MRIKGRFKLEDKNKIFETTEEKVRCSNCLKKIENGQQCYVCEITKDVFCDCWNQRGSPVCKQTILYRKEHYDILCTLRII